MPDPLLYLEAMATSAIVSSLVVLAMARWRRPTDERWLNSACVLSIVLGLAAGYNALALRLTWPPVNGLDRFLIVVVPAALAIEFLAGLRSVPPKLPWILRTMLAAAVPRILLHNSVYLNGNDGPWASWQIVAVLVAGSGLLLFLWTLLSRLSRRSLGSSLPISLSMAILCAGATIMMAGYVKGGAAACPLAVTLVAATVSVRLTTNRSATPNHVCIESILGIGVVGLFSLLFIGRFFGELSNGFALTILLSPLLCWATELPTLRNRKPWLVGTVRLVLVAIPLLVVLTKAKFDFDRDMAPLIIEVNPLQ